MRIKNWKLALLALLMFCFLTSLGFWQLSRAKQKSIEIAIQEARVHQLMDVKNFNKHKSSNYRDLRYYRVQIKGEFDNKHTFLLDNKIYQGKVGYEVYTPFKSQALKQTILVDRGFIAHRDRKKAPHIPEIQNPTSINGMLAVPPAYVSFGDIKDTQERWPLRIEFINLQILSQMLSTEFFPLVIIMDAKDPNAFTVDWHNNSMPPERHVGYAVQWFALAFTLLILFVALNRNSKKQTRAEL